MNPGTTLIIVFGIIGLLLYASLALKSVTKENFAVVDESQLPTNAATAVSKLNPESLQSILGAFTTPDLLTDRPKTLLVTPPTTALPVNSPPIDPFVNKPTISDKQGEELMKPPSQEASPNDRRANMQATVPPPRVITKIRKVYVPGKCPPMPDLRDYVRKDSIPCYGCNLK